MSSVEKQDYKINETGSRSDDGSIVEFMEKGVPGELNEDLTIVESGDLALQKKIHLINDAIDEIGFTWFNLQLFCLQVSVIPSILKWK